MVLSFKLDLQLFASHKAGAIIYRQRGTRVYPGVNTKKGSDDTIFALIDGIVKYERVGKNRKRVSVYEIVK